ncbi:reverse transcriptase domain-containing protein [Tanacetum coccineum]
MGIAEDAIIKVENFKFLADFVIVDFEADPRVPIILERPFLRTARALVDLYEEKLTLRVENEEVVFYIDKSSRNNYRDIHSVHCINTIDFSKDKQSSGSTTSYFDAFLPDYETFCFDIEEKSSGSTTSHSDHSFPEYESFCFDVNHIEEKSSGSTTFHSDISLPEYGSFHFDLSIDPFPRADRNDSHLGEFADELAHIISPPEYDHFYFDIEPDPGELTILFEENISEDSTKELTSPKLNDLRLLLSDCDFIISEKFSEIDLLVSFPSGNEDIIFDPGIFTINGVHSKRFSILLLDDFSSIIFVKDFLFLADPSEIDTFLLISSRNEDKVFDPGIFFINGVFSFTRKTPHLLSDNFLIDKCHSFSEISLMTESSVSFHPKDKEIRGESS